MIKIAGRTILDDGTVICDSSAMMNILYSGRSLSNVFCSDSADQQEWSVAARMCDTTEPGPLHVETECFEDIDWFAQWSTPEPWASTDLYDWCLNKCTTDIESARVVEELNEFAKRDMIPLMQHLMYCVDTWRKHNVVWGVGRGSSVGSFILYLIGVNKINPLEYDLDVYEWLK